MVVSKQKVTQMDQTDCTLGCQDETDNNTVAAFLDYYHYFKKLTYSGTSLVKISLSFKIVAIFQTLDHSLKLFSDHSLKLEVASGT